MGLFTPNAQVWYPETGDTAEINVLLSTLASSIENGLEPRVGKLEANMSMVANLQANQTFVNGTWQTVNYTINATGYNNGFTLSNGAITITEPGLYMFSANLLGSSSTLTSQGFLQTQLQKNGNPFCNALNNLSSNGSSNVAPASMASAMSCVAGDVIAVKAGFFGSTSDTLILSASNPTYNMFSAVLLKKT